MEVAEPSGNFFAEVISIGDEMTTGQRLDTNSQWLSQRLGELGIETRFHTTVADHLESQKSAFEIACSRSKIVVTTGGLGPTADDLTRQVLSDVSQCPLQLDEDSLNHIRNLFESRGRQMPESNRIQAMFPEGSTIILNPFGTAPGIEMQIPSSGQEPCLLFALPGVPAEMTQMWELSVRPSIEQMLGARKTIRHHLIHCFGRGESDIEKMVPGLTDRGNDPQVGITASKATISFRIVATADSEKECQQKIDAAEARIREQLGDLVFGVGEAELQDVVVAKLSGKKARLSLIDCATDQLLGRLIRSADREGQVYDSAFSFSDVPAACKFFGLGTFSAPDTESKRLLALCEYLASQRNVQIVIVADRLEPSDDPGIRKCRLGIWIDGEFDELEVPIIGHPSIREIRFAKFVLNQLRLRLQSA